MRTAAYARATPKMAPSKERASWETREIRACSCDDIAVFVVWFLHSVGGKSDERERGDMAVTGGWRAGEREKGREMVFLVDLIKDHG